MVANGLISGLPKIFCICVNICMCLAVMLLAWIVLVPISTLSGDFGNIFILKWFRTLYILLCTLFQENDTCSAYTYCVYYYLLTSGKKNILIFHYLRPYISDIHKPVFISYFTLFFAYPQKRAKRNDAPWNVSNRVRFVFFRDDQNSRAIGTLEHTALLIRKTFAHPGLFHDITDTYKNIISGICICCVMIMITNEMCNFMGVITPRKLTVFLRVIICIYPAIQYINK